MTCEQTALMERPRLRLERVIEMAGDIRDVAKAFYANDIVYAVERILAAAKGEKILTATDQSTGKSIDSGQKLWNPEEQGAMTLLWICGKRLLVDDENGWELVGVFETEEKAVAACLTGMYFVGPAELNKAFPDERVPWPGAYYPNIKAAT